jgi:hypothetical protein
MVSKVSVMLLWAQYVGGHMYFFNKKNDGHDGKKSVENVDTSLLCKFVTDGTGKKLGESVSVDHDVLIVKSGSLFLGVPLKHIEAAEKTLMVKGLVDFTKAYELGEKWRKESFREMKPNESPEKSTKRF